MHCSNFDFVGNTPAEDRIWLSIGHTAVSMLVSSDGQITTGATLPMDCNTCCIVHQPDGKLLQLGN